MKNNKETKALSNFQHIILVILRMMIGWQLLYEGFIKVMDPTWSSAGFLKGTTGLLSGFFVWISSNQTLLSVVDLLNEWGLFLIGFCLILGLFSRISSLLGAVLLFLYYIGNPPLPGLESSMLVDGGNSLIINKTLIESVTLLFLYVFPTGKIAGLDMLYLLRKKY